MQDAKKGLQFDFWVSGIKYKINFKLEIYHNWKHKYT